LGIRSELDLTIFYRENQTDLDHWDRESEPNCRKGTRTKIGWEMRSRKKLNLEMIIVEAKLV